MKKIIICFVSFILIIGFTGCSSKSELYEKTDGFVQSLETTYESYGLFGAVGNSVTTSDGLYQITPVGRLVNVKILKVASKEEYEDLREDLEDHYKNDRRVNEVYIAKAGTIMIDCRN